MAKYFKENRSKLEQKTEQEQTDNLKLTVADTLAVSGGRNTLPQCPPCPYCQKALTRHWSNEGHVLQHRANIYNNLKAGMDYKAALNAEKCLDT